MDMLNSDTLYKREYWKEESEVLHELMLVKSFEEGWFRQPVLKYIKQKGKDLDLATDKVLFGELFKYLNTLEEDDRETEVDNLRRYVDTARQLAKRQEGLNNLEKKDQKFYNN